MAQSFSPLKPAQRPRPGAIEVVAALLGHARPAPSEAGNVRALDRIFDEVVDSLRNGHPLRNQIETGAAAVASVLDALHYECEPIPTASHMAQMPSMHNDEPGAVVQPILTGGLPQTGFRTAPQINGGTTQQRLLPSPPLLHSEAVVGRAGVRNDSGTSNSVGHTTEPQPQGTATMSQTLPQPNTQPQAHRPQQARQRSFPHVISNANYPSPSTLPRGAPSPYAAPVSLQNRRRQGGLSSELSRVGADARPRRQTRKRYHDAVPSTHCHVCCRPSTAVPMAVCSNIKEGTCRKVVCNRCISDNGWDWEEASAQGSRWICPHCTDYCKMVPRAQCWVYMRTNSRRKIINGLRKKARMGGGGSGSGEGGSGAETGAIGVRSGMARQGLGADWTGEARKKGR